MQTNNQPNPWRIVVITVIVMVLGASVWRFLTVASIDSQALFVGVGCGILMSIPFKLLPRMGESVRLAREYESGYDAGWRVGCDYGEGTGYRIGLEQGLEHSAIAAPQQRELVPVRR